ncbi:MAG TPA: lycopene cyclase family protein [Saprospiraceae bacterium]|nr:lycopene cyclase family protein [Saprospiraceae bacterium]HMP25449.1 lycopene cyclase family protein [Saprospiraceae bacterium]
MKSYDFIIAGGGCAGLSMAYYLAKSNLSGASVLVIDRDEKTQNDRTWCFWQNKTTAFDTIVSKTWQSIRFAGTRGTRIFSTNHQPYQLIRSADFYAFTKAALQEHTNVTFLQADISQVGEDEHSAWVVANGERYQAQWVFNSCFNWRQWQAEAGAHHFLVQHFRGWIIETAKPAFEPQTATLMDFRTAQHGHARFMYVLPFSTNHALVEYTIFSPETEPVERYETVLSQYIQDTLGVEDYTIVETEQGAIPMTDMRLPERAGQRIVRIGTAGGAVKPTTGYAFLRIQAQTQRMVRQLERTGAPWSKSKARSRFRFYDRLLLNILQHEGEQARGIFEALFQRNELHTIFSFLNEETNLWEEVRIFARLPIGVFLRALWRVYVQPQRVKNAPVWYPATNERRWI